MVDSLGSLKESFQLPQVTNILLVNLTLTRVLLEQLCQVLPLAGRKVVQDAKASTFLQKSAAKMGADKASSAGNHIELTSHFGDILSLGTAI